MTPTDLTAGYVSGPSAATEPRRRSLRRVATARRIVLVEGITDQIVIEALAARRGLDLGAIDAAVAPMGGAHAIRTFLDIIRRRPAPPEVVIGLCDERESGEFGDAAAVAGVAQFEFHVCRPDLEAELIRALTVPVMEDLIDSSGDLAALRTLQQQTPWRDRPAHEQIHRFLRAKARRMHSYAGLMVDALRDDEVPGPLRSVVELLGR